MRIRFGMVLVCGLLAGCASVQSANQSDSVEGFAYGAPMRFVTITATRSNQANSQAQKAVNDARDAYITALQAVAPAQARRDETAAAYDEAKALADAAHARGTDISDLVDAAQLARVHADVAAAAFDRLQRAANDARDALTAAQTAAAHAPTGLAETIDLTLGAVVPDPRHQFVATLQDNAFRSLSGSIGAPNGVLQSANITATGGVEPVLIGLAQSAVAFNPARAARNVVTAERFAPPDCDATGVLRGPDNRDLGAETFTRPFDPTDAGAVREVNVALCHLGFAFRIYPMVFSGNDLLPVATLTGNDGSGQAAPVTAQTVPINSPCAAQQRCDGLVYRQSQPMVINVRKYDIGCGGDSANCGRFFVMRSFNLSVPNRSPLNVLPFGDALFVTRHDEAAFVDGSLVSLTFDHPSEAAVAAGIPYRVVNAATTAVSNLVQLRVDLQSRQATLAQAQRTEAAAQAAEPGRSELARLQNEQQILDLQRQILQLQNQIQQLQTTQPPATTP